MMNVQGKVRLQIPHVDCEILHKSLSVDEINLPEDLSSRIYCLDNALIYEVNFKVKNCEKMLSLANTIDDFLRNLKVIINVLKIE